MSSRFGPVTDEQIFLNCGSAKHKESHKVLFNSVYIELFFNKYLYINTVLFTTITGAVIQIVLKIFSLFFGHFCSVMVIFISLWYMLALFTTTSVHE